MFQDPFFSDAPEHVRRPHGDFAFPSLSYDRPTIDPSAAGGLRGREIQPYRGSHDPAGQRGLMPFGFGVGDFSDPFGGIDRMMLQMRSTFDNMHRNMARLQQEAESGHHDGHSFVRQSVYSYSSNGNGAPRVYEAHSSTRTAPGGIRETRRAVRDSEREMEKMAIGHHIGERGHTVERRRNTRTNDREEHNYFEHLGESDESHRAFDYEWVQRTRDLNRHWGPQDEDPRALPSTTAGARRPPPAASAYPRADASAGAGAPEARHRESLSRGFGEGYGTSAFPSYASGAGGTRTEPSEKTPALDYHSERRQ